MLPADIYYVIADHIEILSTYNNLTLCCKESYIGCKKYIDERINICNKMYIEIDCGQARFYSTISDLIKTYEYNASVNKNCVKCDKDKYDLMNINPFINYKFEYYY